MKNKKMTEIDLKRLCLNLLRHAWLILLVSILVACMLYGYARFFVPKKYAAEVRMYVNNTYGAGTEGFSSSQMTAAQSLAKTYMTVLDSYNVLEEVARVAEEEYDASKSYSVAQLRTMINTSSIDETEVFRVVVVSNNKQDAMKIANAINDVLPKEINRLVNGENAAADGSKAAPLVSLQSAEYRGKVEPSEKKYATMGFFLGAILLSALVTAIDAMDTTINSEEFLTDVYEDIPLLAVVPDAENPKASSSYKGYYEVQKKRPSIDQKGGAKK